MIELAIYRVIGEKKKREKKRKQMKETVKKEKIKRRNPKMQKKSQIRIEK